MSDAQLPPTEDTDLEPDDDTLPAEHPAGADATVAAGEVLSGQGVGRGGAADGGTSASERPVTRDATPDDDS